ncbi:hypothetical protein ACIOHS_00120 [Streptomyces sp. NPDC088253]|uniref:hypothetical protein n=1 Tax=Streptomyces sp. NPDC088253 TaxID=3365846 RepID=UPI003803A8DC
MSAPAVQAAADRASLQRQCIGAARVGAGDLGFCQRARAVVDQAIAGPDLDEVGTAFAFFDGATVSLH